MNVLLGVCFCFFLALLSTVLSHLPVWPFTLPSGQHPLEAVVLAILLGMVVNIFWRVPTSLQAGLRVCAKWTLAMAIVLLGARLNWHMLARLPMLVLWIIIGSVLMSLLFSYLLCRLLNVNKNVGLLIAMGTAICGSAAIAATLPLTSSSDDEAAISLSAINLLGLLALFLFPVLGRLWHMPMMHYAVWAGCSIQAVPQTIAAAFAYGSSAGLFGTVVKLARVLMLAPVLMLLSALQHFSSRGDASSPAWSWQKMLPPFVLGFLLMTCLNSWGWLAPPAIWPWRTSPQVMMTVASQFLMAMALAGIGLRTSFAGLYQTGKKPLLYALLAAVGLAALSASLVHFLLPT